MGDQYLYIHVLRAIYKAIYAKWIGFVSDILYRVFHECFIECAYNDFFWGLHTKSCINIYFDKL